MASTEGFSLALSVMQGARPDMDDAQSEVDLPALVTAYSAILFRVAYSVLRSRAEAEDVVQDAFVRVLEHRRSLSGVRDLRVWLVRIAWNLALDRRRRVRPDQLDESFARSLVAGSVAADVALADVQRYTSVLAELERLPKIERSVLLLSAVEELRTDELAVVLGRTESAVRALLSRARQRLRERLEGGKP
jgi:RNA polymerase sigma-70 factor (ECF subfamily)